MKILHVLSTFGTGGAEVCAIEQSNELVRKGHTCDIVTLYDVEESNMLLRKLHASVRHFSLGKKAGLDPSCYCKLLSFIKKGGYDIVHAHVRAIAYILPAAIFLRRVKFFATIHSEAKREAGSNISKWSRQILFKTGLCTPVTISEESQQSFEHFYKMKAPMVYNGVAPYTLNHKLQLKSNPRQIVFVHPASCQPVKNQELLFKAFALLAKDDVDFKVYWIGSKNNYSELFDSLQSIKCEQIQYDGMVSNVRDYLYSADAMCLTSHMEGMPMTIIESFSVGCVPICTPVGGILNMIQDGKNGILSKSLTVDDYYQALKRFCDMHIEDRNLLSQNARGSFEKYSINKSVEGYLKLYSKQ